MTRKRPVSRDILRGRPLLDMCKDRPDILRRNEYGDDDNRIFCGGFVDKSTDSYLDECVNCGAWVYNAEPPENTEATE